MTKDNWTQCPQCKFPALHSEFKRYITNSCSNNDFTQLYVHLSLLQSGSGTMCPMCSTTVKPDELVLMPQDT